MISYTAENLEANPDETDRYAIAPNDVRMILSRTRKLLIKHLEKEGIAS